MVRDIAAPVAVGVTELEMKVGAHGPRVLFPRLTDNVTVSAGPETSVRVPTWKVAVPPFSITKFRGFD